MLALCLLAMPNVWAGETVDGVQCRLNSGPAGLNAYVGKGGKKTTTRVATQSTSLSECIANMAQVIDRGLEPRPLPADLYTLLSELPLLAGDASKAVSEKPKRILSPRCLGTLSLRLCFWQASSELEDEPRPETHGKAHHTPASCAAEAPDQEPAQKQMRLPASAEPTPADVAAIERLTGTTLDVAIMTAVQVESLADEIQASAQEEAASAGKQRSSTRAGAGKIDLFSQSEHAAWSDYDQARLLAGDHVAVRDVSYAELEKQRDSAVAALDKLTEAAKRDRATLVEVYDSIKSNMGGNLEDDLARVAAVTLQNALCETLSPAQLNGTVSPEWTGVAMYAGLSGTLSIADGTVRWLANGDAAAHRRTVALSVDSIIDVEDDITTFVVGTAGADYYFDFGTPGRSAAETLAELDTAEQTLRAGMSAASQRKEAEAALAAEAQHIRSETAAERTTLAEPTATPTPKPTKRVKEGRALREELRAISKLHWRHKIHDADARLAILKAGDAVKEPSVKKRAQEIRSLIFTFGGFNQTQAIVNQFISLPEVSILLAKPKQTKRAVSALPLLHGSAAPSLSRCTRCTLTLTLCNP